MLEGNLSIFISRYCEGDGIQVNPQLFDEAAQNVVEIAAWYQSKCAAGVELEPSHLLVGFLTNDRKNKDIVSGPDRKELLKIMGKIHLYENSSTWGRNWKDGEIWVSQSTSDLVRQAANIAISANKARIGKLELFKTTVPALPSQTRFEILEAGINLDEIAEYVTSFSS